MELLILLTTVKYFIAPLVAAAGIAALSSGAQVYAQGKMNKKTRQWNEKMYNQQRSDNLSDWQMQNEYNSPEAQMQRLKDAGLNPNLIYDQGAAGATGASGDVKGADAKPWNPQTPDYGGVASAVGGSLMTYLGTKKLEAETDNIKKMGAQLEAQTQGTELDNALKAQTQIASIDMQIANAKKAGLDASILEGQKEALMAQPDYQNALTYRQTTNAMDQGELIRSQTKVSSATYRNVLADTGLKMAQTMYQGAATRQAYAMVQKIMADKRNVELENKMREHGTSFSDGIVERALQMALSTGNEENYWKVIDKLIEEPESSRNLMKQREGNWLKGLQRGNH